MALVDLRMLGRIVKMGETKRRRKCIENDDGFEPTSIEVLNNDCLLHIFSFLALHDRLRVERVSKRWQSLNSRAWNNFHQLYLGMNCCRTVLPQQMMIGLNTVERGINDRHMEKILSLCGRFLNALTIHAFKLHCLYVLPSIARHCQNLRRLELCLVTYPEKHLVHVFDCCSKLEYVKLNDLYMTFFGDCLATVRFDRIQELHLIATSTVELTIIGATAISKMINLHKLVFKMFKLSADVLKLITVNDSIKDLSIISCYLNGDDKIVNMVGLKQLDLYNTMMKIKQEIPRSFYRSFFAMEYQNLYDDF